MKSVEGRSRRSSLGWACGQPGGVQRTPYGCPSSARAERHVHASSRDAVDSSGGDHPLSKQVVEKNWGVAFRTRPSHTQGAAKQVAVFTATLADEPLTAPAALVDGVSDQRFVALECLAHTRQIDGGGCMAEPVTALLARSLTVMRAPGGQVAAAHHAAARTITRTLTHGHVAGRGQPFLMCSPLCVLRSTSAVLSLESTVGPVGEYRCRGHQLAFQ